MSKGQRIAIFLITMALLLIGYVTFKKPINSLDDKGVMVLSTLVMLSFTILLIEHFFTKPTDVIASSVSILLMLAPMHQALIKAGIWYWVLCIYNSVVLVVSLISLLLIDQNQPE